jgi:hypothetical protein
MASGSLSKDEVGTGLKMAWQELLMRDMELLLHH